MITYPEGPPARIGDAVVVDDGEHTGTVMHLIDTTAEVEAWGLKEPGLMIDTSYGGLVFYPARNWNGQAVASVSRAAS